ncbi:hypothetical protein HDV00_005513 [Rhizophlyctis rosea]|nr:hypothetical protein HDV00_005513 [Rhizophlyctis rosea]
MAISKVLIQESKGSPQVVKDQPIPQAGKGDILVRIESVALNPVDHVSADFGLFVEKYPTILGVDGAGVVAEVGEGVQKFAKGDRVFFQGEIGNPTRGTFQQHIAIPAQLAAKIPEKWSFDEAATVPLAAITATVGLYDYLKLPLPTPGSAPSGQWILVTGGSGSVGQLVIQLAHTSGLKVVATSSPHNFPLLKSLGATITLDRSSPDIVSQIRSHTADTLTYAYDASGKETIVAAESLSSTQPSKIVQVLPDPEGLKAAIGSKPVEHEVILGTYYRNVERGAEVWRVLERLAGEGKIKPNPVKVLDGGLSGILEGQKLQREGKVSGFKFVARVQETK